MLFAIRSQAVMMTWNFDISES